MYEDSEAHGTACRVDLCHEGLLGSMMETPPVSLDLRWCFCDLNRLRLGESLEVIHKKF